MPAKSVAYLVHNLTFWSQHTVYGRERLLAYLKAIRCPVDKNLLCDIVNPLVGELNLTSSAGEWVCIEELYE